MKQKLMIFTAVLVLLVAATAYAEGIDSTQDSQTQVPEAVELVEAQSNPKLDLSKFDRPELPQLLNSLDSQAEEVDGSVTGLGWRLPKICYVDSCLPCNTNADCDWGACKARLCQ